MTDVRLTPEERAQLAAEYALGVLAAEELAQARALEASDGEFRAQVAQWRGRLAPMLDEVVPAAPSRRVWHRIDSAIGGEQRERDNVVQLRQRVATGGGSRRR